MQDFNFDVNMSDAFQGLGDGGHYIASASPAREPSTPGRRAKVSSKIYLPESNIVDTCSQGKENKGLLRSYQTTVCWHSNVLQRTTTQDILLDIGHFLASSRPGQHLLHNC